MLALPGTTARRLVEARFSTGVISPSLFLQVAVRQGTLWSLPLPISPGRRTPCRGILAPASWRGPMPRRSPAAAPSAGYICLSPAGGGGPWCRVVEGYDTLTAVPKQGGGRAGAGVKALRRSPSRWPSPPPCALPAFPGQPHQRSGIFSVDG